MLIEIELNKLREEIYELKRCQVDFVKLSTILFGVIASIVGVLIQHLKIVDENTLNPLYVIVYISIISIIPLVYPYILWIIIHKCRSIFRIVSYIRVVENLWVNDQESNQLKHHGYESLHRKLKEHPWLTSRLTSFRKIFGRIKKKWSNYEKVTQEAENKWNNEFGNNANYSKFVSVDGLDEKNLGPYIGDYYGKIIFFINLLCSIGTLALMAFAIYGLIISEEIIYKIIFFLIFLFFLIWSIYHYKLLRRYLMELRYRPFSIDSFYDMWMWSIEELNK